MHPVAVVGPDAATAAATRRLAARLASEGAVAVVTDAPTRPDEPTDASPDAVSTQYAVGDGRWHGTGAGDLADVLDRLAPDHDFAVVRGGTGTTLPWVRVGGAADDATPATPDGDRLATAPTAAALDLDAVVAALADTRPHETLTSLVADLKRSPDADRAGAIATFTGRVRTRDGPDDPPTEYLEFEAYDEVAARRTREIRADLGSRDGVWAVRLHHRRGVVEAGEDIVFVAVLAGHRREAFRAVEDGIDRLKAEVPLFKREVTVEGEFWAHERE
jgi:molybdopterin synthase catalytic subunit